MKNNSEIIATEITNSLQISCNELFLYSQFWFRPIEMEPEILVFVMFMPIEHEN